MQEIPLFLLATSRLVLCPTMPHPPAFAYPIFWVKVSRSVAKSGSRHWPFKRGSVGSNPTRSTKLRRSLTAERRSHKPPVKVRSLPSQPSSQRRMLKGLHPCHGRGRRFDSGRTVLRPCVAQTVEHEKVSFRFCRRSILLAGNSVVRVPVC